jgi:carbonic anhydrase/acetyltransferase-like protein (isoleucine patch superfamily)
MLIRHRDEEPATDPTCYIAPTAVLGGDVTIGPRTRVMFGAVLSSEAATIKIGECSVVCENAVLRATKVDGAEHPVEVGDHVMIGPHATLLGCHIARTAYIATGATILHGARIGAGAVVAVGALVHAGTRLPDDFFVPPNMIAIGDPVEIHGLDDPGALTEAVKDIGFLRIAFGVTAGWEDQSGRYEQALEVRSAELESHTSDSVLS